METKIICQELLIFHNSQFFSKEMSEKDEYSNNKKLSKKEQLAEACWNGLIGETMPDMITPLSLNEINEADSFLDLKYGAFGDHIENELSVNPYKFLNLTRFN